MSKLPSCFAGCLVLLATSALKAESWSTVDLLQSPDKTFTLSTISVAPSGKVYAGGWEAERLSGTAFRFLRASSDQGRSWNTPGKSPAPPYFHWKNSLAVNHAGDLFVVMEAGENVFPGPNTYRWVVGKSVDEGATWQVVDDWQSTTNLYARAESILIQTDGVIFVVGEAKSGDSETPPSWIVRKSADNGVTWATVDEWRGPLGYNSLATHITVTEKGLLVGGRSETGDGRSPVFFRRSLDSGLTWETVSELDGTLNSLKPDANGRLWALIQRSFGLGTSTCDLARSADGGLTWDTVATWQPVYFKDLALTPDNTIFIGGRTNNNHWVVLVSKDQGQTWNVSDTFAGAGNSLAYMTADQLGNVYAAGRSLGPTQLVSWVVRRYPGLEPLPLLQITLAGQAVRLAWRTNSGPFVLETAPTPNPLENWSSVPVPVTTDGTSNVVIIGTASAGKAFYRLRSP